MPGRDILISVLDEMSPLSLEGRRAAETLKVKMGRRSVSESIQRISGRALHPSTPVVPKVTKKMLEDTCRLLIRDKHPLSPLAWPEGSEPHTTAAEEASKSPLACRGQRHRRRGRQGRDHQGSQNLSLDFLTGAQVQ